MTNGGASPVPRQLQVAECVWDAQAQLGEGALWSIDEHALYWVDILSCQLHRYQASDRSQTSWGFTEEISSVVQRQSLAGLIVTMRRGIASFDPAHARPTPHYLAQPELELKGNRFNDAKCDAVGRLWAGTMDAACVVPSGSLYRFDPDGQCTRHDDGFVVTNGPTWSADGTTMYYNDTIGAQVYAYDFDPVSGSLANKRQWLRFAVHDGVPDGMTTDAAGRLWIAHWGGSCVTCHDPVTAQELCRISLPASQITSCAFGGAALQTLYITSAATGLSAAQRSKEGQAGAVFSVETDAQGVAAHRFNG